MSELAHLVEIACALRAGYALPPHSTAFRLFNGHLEGFPGVTFDIYGRTLLVMNTRRQPESISGQLQEAVSTTRQQLPWLRCGLCKTHRSPDPPARRGEFLFGSQPDEKVSEGGIWYALALRMHQDAGLYLDTRNLRKWAYENLNQRSVLNCFAYTGSLGVSAQAGGASRVVQADLRSEYLALAMESCRLNNLPVQEKDFIAGDFWAQVGRMKRSGESFDCVILDPPFFSSSPRGKLDLNQDSGRLINKVRPLVNDQGWLVAVNNALYVSGEAYLKTLQALCADGYLRLVDLLPVAEDFTGWRQADAPAPPVDPSPFNHSTKIAILQVRRKASSSGVDS